MGCTPCPPGLCSRVVTLRSPLASVPCSYPCSLSWGPTTAAHMWAAGIWSEGYAFLEVHRGTYLGVQCNGIPTIFPSWGQCLSEILGGYRGSSWGLSGQGLVASAHPTVLARSRAAGGHCSSPSPGQSGSSLGMGRGWAKASRDVSLELGLGPGMGRTVWGVGGSGQASWEVPHTKAAPQGWGWPREQLELSWRAGWGWAVHRLAWSPCTIPQGGGMMCPGPWRSLPVVWQILAEYPPIAEICLGKHI